MGTPRKINDEVLLNLWAEGRLTSGQLAARFRCSDEAIRSALRRARDRGDPRAAYRMPVHTKLAEENRVMREALRFYACTCEQDGYPCEDGHVESVSCGRKAAMAIKGVGA